MLVLRALVRTNERRATVATEEQREAFRQALRHTREQRGLTQRALSRIIGLTNSAVWQWEQGRAIPRPEIVAKLEAALDLDPGVLSRLLGYLPITQPPDKATMDVLDALQADPRLGARERKLLATIYRELVAQREAGQSA
jgi:transcriptional regulator with XRE-family HTH domain